MEDTRGASPAALLAYFRKASRRFWDEVGCAYPCPLRRRCSFATPTSYPAATKARGTLPTFPTDVKARHDKMVEFTRRAINDE